MNNRFATFAAVLLFISSGTQGSRAQEASSNAAPTPDVNPESDTGALKAQVTTGGSYDAHSGNATRIVNDLQVPDALGDYGLDFTRYWNSLQNEDTNLAAESPLDFGFSGWSHSWRWSATYNEEDLHDPEVTNHIDYETSITITFPDGHATKFKIVRTNYASGGGALRFGPPYDDQPIDWPIPGPHAHDRLVDMDPNGLQFWLSRADGGSVHFVAVGSSGNPRWLYYQADKVYDPHGFLTELEYENGYLRHVKQEGNRRLTINWKMPVDYNILLIDSVETGGNAGFQRVAYKYRRIGGQNGQTGLYVLTFVDYDESIPGHTTSAHYTYGNCYGENDQCSGLDRSSFPLLKAADDPNYSGAMTKIRYNYYGSACPTRTYPPPSPTPGYYDWFYFTPTAISKERSGETGQVVSEFVPACESGIRTDKNGIGGWRRFYYGTSGRDNDVQCPGRSCMGYDLVKLTDFAMAEPLVDNVPRRRQNGPEPTLTIDGRGIPTYPQFEDGSGNPSYIGFADESNCTYNRTNPDTSPASASPEPVRIHNEQHHWLFSEKDERGKVTTYRRDGRRLVTDIKYHDNSTEHFEYNTLNQVTSHKLPSLAIETYEYNALNRLQLVHNTVDRNLDGEMADKFYEYDSLGRVSTVTEGRARSNGVHTVTMLYNRRHQVTSVEYPPTSGVPPTVRYEYDKYGNCTKITDELNNERTYTYDSYRRCTSYTEPVNNACGAASRTWNWIYDRVIVNDSNIEIGQYPASAHTSKEWRIQIEPIFNAQNERRATDRTFDVNNRIVAERTGWIQRATDPLGTLTVVPNTTETHSFTYDKNGQKEKYIDPLGRRTEYEYDERNRLKITTEYPTVESEGDTGAPRVTETHYDTTGNKIWVKFPDGEIQEWPDYSPFGQPLQFKDERGHFTELAYQWGPMKKLSTVTTHRQTDGGGTEHQLTTFSYDEMGRSTSVLFPDGTDEITAYQYGQIHTWKTRRDQLKTITLYDARGRERQHVWANGAAPTVNRVWDDANRLKYIANSFSSIDYQYNDAGQVSKERSFVVGTDAWKELSYCHYPSGEVSTITYPDQTVISRSYTARGQLQGVGWVAGATSYEYLADGKVSYQSYTNQMRTDYRYNGRGFVSSVSHKNNANQNLAYRTYWRDDRDRIEAWKRGEGQSPNVMEDGRGDRYEYDEEGQLIKADYRTTDPEGAADAPMRRDIFHYDELGNRMGANDIASRGGSMWIQRRDNGLNQYESWNNHPDPPHIWGSRIFHDDNFPAPEGPSAPWRWRFPGNGVMMADGWNTASYNALNQPVAMGSLSLGNNFIWFGHDPLGRCVKRWKGTDDGTPVGSNPVTYFYYDGWNLVQEGGGASSPTRLYVHGGRVDEIVASFAASSNQWASHHYDARGHCILLTDINGNIIEQYDYDAFGQPYCYTREGAPLRVDGRPGSPWGNRFLFTGREWLDDLKIYDFRNRMYQPELGRFLQPDPMHFGAGDYNLYRYCHNDPINHSDPTGLWSPKAHDKILDHSLKDRLSKDDLAKVQKGSRDFDKATQGKSDVHKHSMRQKGESIKDALNKRDKFVDDTVDAARAANAAGDRDGALRKLGEALHPIMDASSPMHSDASGNPMVYRGIRDLPGHSPTDFIGRETSKQLTDAILSQQRAAINVVVDRVFGP